MTGDPVSDMAARRRLTVAPDAEVLLMTRHAPLAVSFGHEPVGQGPPCVRMVSRHARVVAGNAIRFFVTDKAIVAERSLGVHERLHGPAVVFEPVCRMRSRLGKAYLPGSGLAA